MSTAYDRCRCGDPRLGHQKGGTCAGTYEAQAADIGPPGGGNEGRWIPCKQQCKHFVPEGPLKLPELPARKPRWMR